MYKIFLTLYMTAVSVGLPQRVLPPVQSHEVISILEQVAQDSFEEMPLDDFARRAYLAIDGNLEKHGTPHDESYIVQRHSLPGYQDAVIVSRNENGKTDDKTFFSEVYIVFDKAGIIEMGREVCNNDCNLTEWSLDTLSKGDTFKAKRMLLDAIHISGDMNNGRFNRIIH